MTQDVFETTSRFHNDDYAEGVTTTREVVSDTRVRGIHTRSRLDEDKTSKATH